LKRLLKIGYISQGGKAKKKFSKKSKNIMTKKKKKKKLLLNPIDSNKES
jgi:hypothetical protein